MPRVDTIRWQAPVRLTVTSPEMAEEMELRSGCVRALRRWAGPSLDWGGPC